MFLNEQVAAYQWAEGHLMGYLVRQSENKWIGLFYYPYYLILFILSYTYGIALVYTYGTIYKI